MSLVGDLVRQLDGFNQLRPSASEEDEEDMAWPGIRRRSRLCSMSLAPIMLNILRMTLYIHVYMYAHMYSVAYYIHVYIHV